jgi:nucleotide-binding universal stress UspA family protein
MRTDTYVVAFDGSPGASAALAWALDIAAVDGATVEALAVWSPPVPAFSPWLPDAPVDLESLYDAFVAHVDDAAAAVAAGRPLSVRSATGPAGATLVDAARDARALVVGRRSYGGFAGLLLGSVADDCLRHATCPVALVPEHDAGRADGSVVVGVDGSAAAAAALRFAAAEAERLGRPLVALHAWDWLAQPEDFDFGFDADAARSYASKAVEAAVGDTPVEIVVANDRPAAALMARSAAGDLVVVGSRGHGAVRRVLLGSVSRQLAHHSAATVIVVRTPEEDSS